MLIRHWLCDSDFDLRCLLSRSFIAGSLGSLPRGSFFFIVVCWRAVADYSRVSGTDRQKRPAYAIARLSESRFKTRFKREMGVPPEEFWLRQKIERATVLLKTRNVTEVAHELGFSSSQYFATVFKRYTRVSPSRFHARGKA